MIDAVCWSPCFKQGDQALGPVVYSPMHEFAHPNLFFEAMTNSTEPTELDGLRRLDPQGISVVFDRYYPEVFRFVRYRLGDDLVAEDIASEVFVRLLEAIRTNRGPQTNLKAWLLATASHIATDHMRKKYRRPTSELPETLPDLDTDPPGEYEKRERDRHLTHAMSLLTDEQQNVLALRFSQAYSLDETASLLKKNVNAIKQLQFRALAALHRALGDLP